MPSSLKIYKKTTEFVSLDIKPSQTCLDGITNFKDLTQINEMFGCKDEHISFVVNNNHDI